MSTATHCKVSKARLIVSLSYDYVIAVFGVLTWLLLTQTTYDRWTIDDVRAWLLQVSWVPAILASYDACRFVKDSFWRGALAVLIAGIVVVAMSFLSIFLSSSYGGLAMTL